MPNEDTRCWCGACADCRAEYDFVASRIPATDTPAETRDDTARLNWLEANADMILGRNHFTQDEYRTPATLWCYEEKSLREKIDAWMTADPHSVPLEDVRALARRALIALDARKAEDIDEWVRRLIASVLTTPKDV